MGAMSGTIRKAVFPAAGLGTRFLPATKAQPKEMLVLVDKPVIQYGVEEAVQSGVDNIVIVTGRGKNAIEDHFDVAVELESYLEQRGKTEQLEEIRKITQLINVSYVRQGEPLGLGHAVLVTQNLIGNEPFAVILGDDVIDANPPALKQMIDVFQRVDGPVLAVERVPAEDVSSYGVVKIDESAGDLGRGVYRIADLAEGPRGRDGSNSIRCRGFRLFRLRRVSAAVAVAFRRVAFRRAACRRVALRRVAFRRVGFRGAGVGRAVGFGGIARLRCRTRRRGV